MTKLIQKELDASWVEPKSNGLIDLTEAEIDTVSGGLLDGNTGKIHINNIRLANNIKIGEVNIFPFPIRGDLGQG
jgi:hypothetical protein